MRRLEIVLGALAGATSLSVAAASPEGPALGVPATPEQVASWDVSIGPDGARLPPGAGTPRAGAAIFAEKCSACHGEDGQGNLGPRLVGGHGTIATAEPVRTVGSYWPYATTIFDFVRRAMPLIEPRSLTDEEVYALTAHLLRMNGIVDENFVAEAGSLPKVQMPNGNGFVSAYPK